MHRPSIVVSGLSIAAVAGFALVGLNAPAEATNASTTERISSAKQVFNIDAGHSGVIFKIRHDAHSNFYGRFDAVRGEFHWDGDTPTNSSVELQIPIESVNTGNEKRDDHLKSADFFNGRQYPNASFSSTGMRSTGEDNTWELMGDLTMHGVTRPITAELSMISAGEGPRGGVEAGFEATFSIKRSDFGITSYLADDGGEGGGLGNTVEITVFVEGHLQD